MENDEPVDKSIDDRAAIEMKLWKLFKKIKEEKKPTGPSNLARRAKISRSYFYTFHELAKEVAEYGRKTQPGISRRGACGSKTEAKKRDIDDRVRREHTKWAKEFPKLEGKLEEANDEIATKDKEIVALRGDRECLRRGCELLLMLASEAGASPIELEKIMQIAGKALDLDGDRDFHLKVSSLLKSDLEVKPN
jgi:hypothetical protein